MALAALVWAGLNVSRLWKTDTHGAKLTETSIQSKAVPGERPVSVVVPDGRMGIRQGIVGMVVLAALTSMPNVLAAVQFAR